MIQQLVRIFLLAITVVSANVAKSSSGGNHGNSLTKKWTLYHSIGSGNEEWTPRGTVSLEISPVDATTTTTTTETSSISLTIDNNEGCLSEAALSLLQTSDWYKLKLVEEPQQGSSSSSIPQDDENYGNDFDAAVPPPPPPVITMVPSCQVRRANFRDEMVLTFGRMGHVVSMAYMPLVSPLAPKTCQNEDWGDYLSPTTPEKNKVEFKSRISYETAVPGMKLANVLPSYQPPPGLKMISKTGRTVSQTATPLTPDHQYHDGAESMQGGGGGKNTKPGVLFDEEEGDGKGGRRPEEEVDASPMGFIKRYWYILLPIMIMNFMQAPPPDNQQQQGSGQGEQGQPQSGGGGSSGGAAPAGGGGGAAKRRGKRSN